jgi:hypothetical protein
MTATTTTPRPGPPGRGTGWTVTTDASAARAAAVTGATGWRRPAPGKPVRRSFATEDEASRAVRDLLQAGHDARRTPPIAGTGPKSSGMRIPPDVWAAAGRALDDQQGQRRVAVTLAPGTSRSAAVIAFLRALATQVSAGDWAADVLAGCEDSLAEALGPVGGMGVSTSAKVDTFGDRMTTVTLTDAAVEHLTRNGNAEGRIENGILWIHGAGFELRRATYVSAEKS